MVSVDKNKDGEEVKTRPSETVAVVVDQHEAKVEFLTTVRKLYGKLRLKTQSKNEIKPERC